MPNIGRSFQLDRKMIKTQDESGQCGWNLVHAVLGQVMESLTIDSMLDDTGLQKSSVRAGISSLVFY